MRNIKEEVLAIKRNKNKEDSQRKDQKIGSTLRSNRKIGSIERTLEAISRGEDTSVADDSEVIDMDYLPEAINEWPTLNDSQTFKRPLPTMDGRNSGRTISSTFTKKNPQSERHKEGSEDQMVRNKEARIKWLGKQWKSLYRILRKLEIE